MSVDREQIRQDIAQGRNVFNPEHIAALLTELEQAEEEADQLDNRLDAANLRLVKADEEIAEAGRIVARLEARLEQAERETRHTRGLLGDARRELVTAWERYEQAEKQANCDCVPCVISSKSCRKCGRRAIITQEQFVSSVSELEARLAKVPALVENAKRFAEEAYDYACQWPIGLDTDPQEQRGMARDTFIRNAEAFLAVLAAWEQE